LTATVPIYTPTQITAGLNADWKRQFKDSDGNIAYSYSDSWVVTYYLICKSVQYTITGTDNGDTYHRFTKLASETSNYEAGLYSYTAVAVNGTSKVAVESGVIEIRPNFITATGGLDSRSSIKIILDNLDDAILELSTKTTTEVTVNGTTYKRANIVDLLKARDRYQTLYNQELASANASNGFSSKNKIYVRFMPR